jgi:hypothetical protein
MVFHVAGRLGSGKTFWCVHKIIETLVFTRKEIVTNIRLVDFWDMLLGIYVSKGIKSFIKFIISPFPDLYNFRLWLAASYVDRYRYFSDIVEAVDYAFLKGEAFEGSKLFIWDEIHLDLNAREWKTTSKKMIQFFSMSRKLGYDVIIVSQLRSAVDRQMRDLADISYELKNMRNWKFFNISLFPNVGLLIKRWANKGFEHGGGMFVGAGIVRYGSNIGQFYDTMQLLTDKTKKDPQTYSSINRGVCSSCAYMQYYINYSDFVFRYAPRSLINDGKLPIRLVYKDIGYPDR